MSNQNGICKEKCNDFPQCQPCRELNENELWKKSFEILLSKGDVYSYDYNAAIAELKLQGFSISQAVV